MFFVVVPENIKNKLGIIKTIKIVVFHDKINWKIRYVITGKMVGIFFSIYVINRLSKFAKPFGSQEKYLYYSII